MKKLRILLRVTGTIRIALGLFSLLAPAYFLESIGHTIPEDDIFYPFGMLASRSVVLGVMFIYITKDPMKRRLWIVTMIFIQLIDLAVGVFYTATGVVALSDSLVRTLGLTGFSQAALTKRHQGPQR
jgi:hypothetical protein